MNVQHSETKAVNAKGDNLRFAIIGAGMSGILTAIKLREAGYNNFTIYEKADKLGGTWRENTYPGLSCDVPSHLYRYAFEPNPNWSKMFSPGQEIWEYFDGVARKYDVEGSIKYNQEVTKTEYKNGKWYLETADGGKDTVDFVIAATGVLHHPVFPDIEGLGTFEGDCFHSAQWDHDAKLEGKRIGIIGTGSTAIQIVPAIIDDVEKVSLFQRTPQWVLPLPNPDFTEEEKAAFRDSPEEMENIYNTARDHFAGSFSEAVIGDQTQRDEIQQLCEGNLNTVKDPELREKLTPNYQAMCKRLIMSDDFYPAIQKPNAHVVTEGIERIEAGGVRTKDGVLHELDVLVIATGFDGHAFTGPMNIVGRNGVTLEETWADSKEAYRSVAVPEFPNFFMLVGPNSPIGNFSLIIISETQVDYIMQLVDLARDGKCREIAAKRDATDRFNADIKEAMKDTIWVSGCSSWYIDKNGNPAMWPWSFQKFVDDMKKPDLNDFELSA
jgi:cation diffusion facilitator CzcD-associated flavoprotein CzcO